MPAPAPARFDLPAVLAALERELRAAGTPARAVQEKRYLKSELEHFGASMPAIRQAATAVRRAHPELPREALVALVEALWQRPVHELRAAAVELLDQFGSRLVPADLALLERLLRESRTWALVDGLAANVVGQLVERHPSAARTLDRWARDPDFWIRRAALLALLLPLRRGEGDFERFARYAEPLLEEKEFFIRKAIGWVLRETSKKRPDLVWSWLRPRASRASVLTLREASKYLPPERREALLAAATRAPAGATERPPRSVAKRRRASS